MPSHQSQTKKNKPQTSWHKPSLELFWLTAWQRQAWWLWLLLPLSGLYAIITGIKKWGYQHKLFQRYHAPIPVLVVGNITVGGSGKTPLIANLVQYLTAQGVQVGVISRGYGGDERAMPCMVTASSSPQVVGDEPYMLVRQTGVAMSVCPNRQLAVECLLEHQPNLQLIIADDGLQHHKLGRALEWIVVDSQRGFGNGQLLPTGFLRDPIKRLCHATVIWHGTPDLKLCHKLHVSSECIMRLQPATPYLLHPTNTASNAHPSIHQLSEHNHNHLNISESTDRQLKAKQKVYAVSGIGYPKRFFLTLTNMGYHVIEKPLPDHHQFSGEEFLNLTDYPIITTEKDAVKIAPLLTDSPQLQALDIWVLPVRAVLSKACYQTLDEQLGRLGLTD